MVWVKINEELAVDPDEVCLIEKNHFSSLDSVQIHFRNKEVVQVSDMTVTDVLNKLGVLRMT